MRIDIIAYSSRWRPVHPGEKGLFTLFCLSAALLSSTPAVPLTIAVGVAILTVTGAGVNWREYIRLAVIPALFLLWSCLALAISVSGGEVSLVDSPALHLTLGISRQGVDQATLAFARSLGATIALLFLALTTPMTEVMALLRTLRVPRLLIELMTIAYRQIFIFLEIVGQIRSAQEARLGYATLRQTVKSLGILAGNILIKCLSQAHQSHQGLLARGYDSDLHFLSPRHTWSRRNLTGTICIGIILISLALRIRP